jgi:hypothetical protein
VESFKLALIRLEDDIKAAGREYFCEAGAGEQSGGKLDKQKLYRVLRLGYLAFPKFRYFAEMDEMERLGIVVKAVIDIYAGSEPDLARSGDSLSMDDVVLSRLKKMNGLDLVDDAVARWKFEQWKLA